MKNPFPVSLEVLNGFAPCPEGLPAAAEQAGAGRPWAAGTGLGLTLWGDALSLIVLFLVQATRGH